MTQTAQIIDLLPNNVIETFIRARAPQNPHDRIPLEQVNLDYTVAASANRRAVRQRADLVPAPTPARCAWKTSSTTSAK